MSALQKISGIALLLVSTLHLGACSTQDVNDFTPAVSDSLMIQVLIDMHLAEAHAEILNQPIEGMQDSILSYHTLSREDYEANMAYYRENPDAFHKIYSEVLDKISEERFQPGG